MGRTRRIVSARPDAHVVHIVPALFDRERGILGGAERYAFELARHMARQLPTTLLSFGKKERTERLGELRIRVIGRPWCMRGQRHNPIALSVLPELLKADIIHCHQQHVLISSLAALVGRLSGRRVFVSDLGGGGWDISAYLSTDRWYHGHLHLSEYSRRIHGHANDVRARVIWGGVDADKFLPNSSLRPDGSVLFVGRLLPHKGIDLLIRAMPDDMELRVVGVAYDKEYLHYLRQLAVNKRVSFHHDWEDAEIIRAYQRVLCTVLPSVYRDVRGCETKVPELLGQTLLESMSCGAPVICSNVGGMPEVVRDGVTGFIVPPNDSPALHDRIRWIREHREEAKAMGMAARAHVLKNFTWPIVVRRCLEAYAA